MRAANNGRAGREGRATTITDGRAAAPNAGRTSLAQRRAAADRDRLVFTPVRVGGQRSQRVRPKCQPALRFFPQHNWQGKSRFPACYPPGSRPLLFPFSVDMAFLLGCGCCERMSGSGAYYVFIYSEGVMLSRARSSILCSRGL